MYKPYIALEVRILLADARGSSTKTFCGCRRNDSCPVCRGEAGVLPRLNQEAVKKTCLLARGLGGSIPGEVPFEQNLNVPETTGGCLSRLSVKLGVEGGLDVGFHRRKKRVRIAEIRLEEDGGRLIRSGRPARGGREENSGPRWDYSSLGMPSIRLRTAADLEIGEEAEIFLTDLRRRIQYLEILSNPREGRETFSGEISGEGRVPIDSVIRCNAYVAIAPYPEPPRDFVKLRNLNSFNFVYKAVNAELSRQEEILAGGGAVTGESRLWNEGKNETESFQPGPHRILGGFRILDIPPFIPGADIRGDSGLLSVELPQKRRDRLMDAYGLTREQAEFICDEKSRADYFEEAVALGSPPRETARWLASYVIKEFRRLSGNAGDTPLTPRRFARIMGMLREKRIHVNIARQLITAVLTEDREGEELIRERGWEQITDRKTVEGIVKRIIKAREAETRRIREGEAGPIQFLTGLIMKETGGLAEPSLVKEVLREQLSVSLVYVLSMGGAISGRPGEEGMVESGDEQVLRDLLAKHADASRVRFEPIQVGRLLSGEIVPADWAALIAAIAEKLASGTANGIVVAHGTDALPYTAPLLYWLFADAGVPIVLAASSTPPAAGSEAGLAMRKAIDLALDKSGGVYVVYGGKVLSPLNLKFERTGSGGFRNWNMDNPLFSGTSLLTGPLETDRYVLTQLLEDAVNSMCVIRIYPGLRSDYLTALMDRGVKNFFLELYDRGTADLREGPYSLKRVFAAGKRRGVRFYCTSQQEGTVDFSGYTGSRELWRSGAVPMGAYTTETAAARFLAAGIIADSGAELAALMEEGERGIPGYGPDQ